jgi:hypothetical protein
MTNPCDDITSFETEVGYEHVMRVSLSNFPFVSSIITLDICRSPAFASAYISQASNGCQHWQ